MTSTTPDRDANNLIQLLDGSGSDAEWAAVLKLREVLGERLPDFLLRRFNEAKSWQVRSSCIYHAIRYAKTSDVAISLALQGLNDRSKVVRYRACMLLAWSQNPVALSGLKERLLQVPEISRPDVLAAIDAIESKNENYFVDRDHSGMVTLNIR